MTKRPTLEEVEALFSRRFQPLKITVPKSHPPIPQGPTVLVVPKDERPRRALNKTETEWGRRIQAERPDSFLVAQPIRFFKLIGGGTYTPDFLEFREELPVIVWEVKGGYKGPGAEQGYDRYKRAALQWSDGRKFQFKMATKRKSKWEIDEWKYATLSKLPAKVPTCQF